MQTATLFPNGTAIRGFGNFEGTVTGEGEKYAIKGEAFSEVFGGFQRSFERSCDERQRCR